MVGLMGKAKFLSRLFSDSYTRPKVSKTMQEKMLSGVAEMTD